MQEFAENPIVPVGLEDFTQTLELGNPLLAGLAPEQANCNYLTLAFRNLASLESENIGVGTLARAEPRAVADGPQQRGLPRLGARPTARRSNIRFNSTAIIDNNHLHANPYPNVAGPGQPRRSAKRATRTTSRARP